MAYKTNKKIILEFILVLLTGLLLIPPSAKAQSNTVENLKFLDTDTDSLTDYEETYIYYTDPLDSDTDKDGYEDGSEVLYNYDPNKNGNDKLAKQITVTLADQTLAYALGPYNIDQFKISSGAKGWTTPKGEFSILVKKPAVTYKGSNYYYPNTRWNMMFKQQKGGNLYIHGAYWHDKFGTPVSHGCVNVPYADIENLYNWAAVGTKVVVR